MLKSLKKIFVKADNNLNNSNNLNSNEELNLLCGIMVEAALADGKVDEIEINKISNILVEKFDATVSEVDLIVEKCLKEIDEPKSLYSFTSKFNKLFSEEKKYLLIETLWEILLIDGEVHDFESNLIRRLAGLLYISDVSCGNAKKKALLKLNHSRTCTQ